jgi:inward rectifier potassium channel
VAIKKAVAFDLATPAPEAYRWLLCGALATTFLACGLIDSVTERREAEMSDRLRVNARIFAGVILLLLAPAGGGMTAGAFLALVTAVSVGQVVFDLMMAPLQAVAANLEARTVADVVREQQAGGPARVKRARFGEAVRLGTPSDLRSDVYFYFMDGGWFRLFAAIAFVYLMLNVFFATLYYLQPGCIANAVPGSFADAFYFSVQTLSTVGYGALHPAPDYGNAIMTIELGVGLLAVALIAGLVFAKVSRPKASVLFSKSMVVTPLDGVPTLIFRAGNARGNDVVDASVTVTALIDTVSPEGIHLRKLTDLHLLRARSPVFTVTWVVMHKIDAASPLFGLDAAALTDRLQSIIVTMLGHDGTYNQTVHTRKLYYPEDIRWGHRFVDVISQLPDGRMQIDYRRFHDTEPDGAPAPSPVS